MKKSFSAAGSDKSDPLQSKPPVNAPVRPLPIPATKQCDNHANQLNPNNPAYWQSRGLIGPPDPI